MLLNGQVIGMYGVGHVRGRLNTEKCGCSEATKSFVKGEYCCAMAVFGYRKC
jgi:hypothetical protein